MSVVALTDIEKIGRKDDYFSHMHDGKKFPIMSIG